MLGVRVMIPFWAETLLLMAAAYFLGAALACAIRRSLAPAAVGAVPAERRVDPLPEAVAQRAAQRAQSRRDDGPVQVPAAPEPQSMRPAVAVAQPHAAAAAGPQPLQQDLKCIQGVDAGTAARLNGLGITRYEQIAGWTRADVERVSQALGQKGRIARENWIEQAQILAKGGQTLFSVRRARGEASTAAPSPDEGEPAPPPSEISLPRAMSRAGVAAVVIAPAGSPGSSHASPQAFRATPSPPSHPPLVSDRAAFAQQGAPVSDASTVPIRPAESPTHDNLQRIGGITAEIEAKLNALGVSRYSEIAQWSPAVVERVDKELGTSGRISRENWIEQAQILSRGGDTRFSREFDRRGQASAGSPPQPIKLPEAIRQHKASMATAHGAGPPRSDLASLRSVRSDAYQDTSEPGPEAARRAASRRVVRTVQTDDLKRIKGIGFQIEKQLNALGVATYEDIANWTSEDIDRISKSLDFQGRIQRENWVEQARILAAGGDTEFSRRTDRETGRR
jgi:predicted flap endonuclease-1-like 5' DNA nuclease